MQNSLPDQMADKPSLAIVLHNDATDAIQSIRQASQHLDRLEIKYEILVIGDGDTEKINEAIQGEVRQQIRFCRQFGAGPVSFGAALRTACSESRADTIVVAGEACDLSRLASLVPLADQHDMVVSKTASGTRGTGWVRPAAMAYRGMARVILGFTPPGFDGNDLWIISQAAAKIIVPESTGLFGATELLARARQQELRIAEVSSGPPALELTSVRPRARLLLQAMTELTRFWWNRVQFPAAPAPARPAAFCGYGLALALLAALVLFSDINHPLLDPEEGRQAEIPREMLHHNDLLVPRMLGEPYYEKPPLQYWLTAGAYELLGLRPWVGRLIPTSAAWMAILLAFAWGSRMLGVRAAFLGGIVLCSTPAYITLGRMLILDSLLTVCVVAAWCMAHTAIRSSNLRRSWWVLSAVACGLGILAKGPVELVLVMPPLLAFQWLTPASARPRFLSWAAYLAITLLVASPWYIAMSVREPAFLEQFLWKSHVLRFVQGYIHEQPWWFYVPLLAGVTIPWSFLWPALGYFLLGRGRRVSSLRSRGLGFSVLAFSWCLLFYSLSGCKSPPYIQPALVPLAFMLGACLDGLLVYGGEVRSFSWNFSRQLLPRWTTWLILLVSGGGVLATVLISWQHWKSAFWELGFILAFVGVWWRFGRRSGPRLAWSACALAALTLNLFAVQDLVSGFSGIHSARKVARTIRHWPGQSKPILLGYGRLLPSMTFYLRRDIVNFFPPPHLPFLISWLQRNPETLVIVEQGPLLDELVASLPPDLVTELVFPDHEGQAALVVVRHRKPVALIQRP